MANGHARRQMRNGIDLGWDRDASSVELLYSFISPLSFSILLEHFKSSAIKIIAGYEMVG